MTAANRLRYLTHGSALPKAGTALVLALAGLTALVALAGCAPASPAAAPPSPEARAEPTVVPPAEAVAEPARESVPTPAGGPPASPPGEANIQPILATTVLNPGPQRVAFLLAGPRAIIKAPEVTVAATYAGDDPTDSGGSPQMAQAAYHGWPYGIRGAYSTRLTFDRPGPWRLEVSVEEGEVTGSVSIDLEVVEAAPVPAIGERPPLSLTKTLDDVESVEQLTTDYTPDEDMYRISVAEAIESARPSVVVFSSPAFCTSPTCGPQLETVKELKAAYLDRADFVHVEVYDFPDEIQGDLSRATLVEAVDEWGFSLLPHWFNESWVFIMVEQRFEGYATGSTSPGSSL